MDRFESKEETRLINAARLVNMIAHAGPGGTLFVRVRSKDGRRVLGVGKTSWRDDRVGGPAVIFPNPKNNKEKLFIPLGGQVMYDMPPRVSALTNARAIDTPIGEARAHQNSTNPIAQEYSFELIPG
jgi:hypothetical protein